MIELKKDSARAQHFINSYNYHLRNDQEAQDLRQIYGRYSRAKYEAFKKCQNIQTQLNGEGARFCGHNCDKYSFAFTCHINGVKYLIYFTSQNIYKIEM